MTRPRKPVAKHKKPLCHSSSDKGIASLMGLRVAPKRKRKPVRPVKAWGIKHPKQGIHWVSQPDDTEDMVRSIMKSHWPECYRCVRVEIHQARKP